MDNAMSSQAEGDEEILTFVIPDEALERAANSRRSHWSIALTTGIPAIGHSDGRIRLCWLRYVWLRTTLLRVSKRRYCKSGNGGNEL
jgi:hypothetical protein